MWTVAFEHEGIGMPQKVAFVSLNVEGHAITRNEGEVALVDLSIFAL